MHQTINFDPDCSAEEKASALANQLQTSQLCSSIIYGTDVTINLTAKSHTSGSSLVTTKDITKYAWAMEKIPGNLISIHCSGNYIAYAIKGPKGQGLLRIIHCRTGARGLIKDIAGLVRDLSFAYLKEQVLLASVDQYGSLYVHEISDDKVPSNLGVELKLKVVDLGAFSQRAKYWHESLLQRVVWCPYIPEDPSVDESDEDNSALMLTVTNGTVAEVWHLGMVLEDFTSPHLDHEPKVGYHMITDHSGAITDAAFSPDGTALATASIDGYVKFFQMKFDIDGAAPRCLHQWNPHNYQPVSCLFFLDNYKYPNVDGLWKYAVTGANNNTELKVWSCQNWKCHQTINFNLIDNSEGSSFPYFSLRASIDPSSRHIVLSDYVRRVLYVAILNQDSLTDSSSDSDERETQGVKFISISEIPIQMGTISLAISDATFKIYKQWKDETHLSQEEGDDETDLKIVEGLVMQCFLINQKSLQEAKIKFQPCLPLEQFKKEPDGFNVDSSRNDSISLQDGLTDLSLTINTTTADENTTREENILTPSFPDMIPEKIPDNGTTSPPQKLHQTESLLSPHPSDALSLNLLTPESFNTIPNEEFEILNDMGLHIGSLDDLLHSKKNATTPNKSATFPVYTSGTGAEFGNACRNAADDEWGNKLSGAVASSPTKAHMATHGARSNDNGDPAEHQPAADLLQPHDARVTVSSSTSSPSLEVQQILHNHNGKIEEYMDAEDNLIETDKTGEENEVKSLAEILAPYSVDSREPLGNVWKGQVPMLPNAPGMQMFTPTMSAAKEILSLRVVADTSGNDILGSNNALNEIDLLHSRPNSETDQAPQLSQESSQDSQVGPFQLKNLPPIALHMTCEELEAHMKSETPVSKSDNTFPLWDVAEPQKTPNPHLSNVPAFNSSTIPDFCDQFTAIQSELASIKNYLHKIDPKLNKQLNLQASKLAGVLDKMNKTNKKLVTASTQMQEVKNSMDRFVETLPNIVAVNVRNGFDNTFKKDVKSTMHQATAKSMESIRGGMMNEVRGLIATMERQMTDHVSRILHSKALMDSISVNVTSSLSNSINSTVKECHNKVLVPSFNASASQMFAQMNEVFSNGTKEYMNHVQTETRALESAISDRLTRGCRSLESASSLAESLANSQSQNNGISEALESRLRVMLREEVTKALQEQSALIERNSRAQTPLAGSPQSPFSVKNAQLQLQSYISRQEFNSAFKHALMLSDLSLVVFVCERVNPHQLFSHSPCPLTQEVLLSLINQLSYDLSTYTDLKIKYLEEAVMTLDMNQLVTKEHVRHVLGDCQRALTNHLNINPNQKKLKMLLLAVNQLLSSA